MKKRGIIRAFITAFLISIIFCFPSLADEKGITSIDITGVLRTDGSCDITEVWEIDDVYKGTEYYIALHDLKDMSVTDLTVTDDSGTIYETLDEWVIKASFEEKTHKCGLLKKNEGYEICWGISQMGSRTYTISYRLNNLVKEYSDQAGFYYRFISDELSSPPQSVRITLSMEGTELTPEDTQIWAFGCEGQIQLMEGNVVAWSESELDSNDYLNLLVGFSNDLFEAKQGKGTFEKIKDKALDKGENAPYIILGLLGFIVVLILAIGALYTIITRNIKLANGTKVRRIPLRKVEAMTTVPFNKSIPMVCAAIKLDGVNMFPTEPIATYLIKWQLDDVIKMDDVKGKPVIQFLRIPEGDKIEQNLYKMLMDAGDGEFLNLADWEKWAMKNYKKRESWQKRFERDGDTYLQDQGWAAKNDKGKMRFTQNGYDMHIRMLGFYQYLRSFKKKTSDMSAPREYWGDYLVFATLFNLAKPVANGLQNIDGEGFDSFCGMYHMNPALFLLYINHANTMSHSSNVGAYDGSGAIGMSGGGGFSGGGGGGSR